MIILRSSIACHRVAFSSPPPLHLDQDCHESVGSSTDEETGEVNNGVPAISRILHAYTHHATGFGSVFFESVRTLFAHLFIGNIGIRVYHLYTLGSLMGTVHWFALLHSNFVQIHSRNECHGCLFSLGDGWWRADLLVVVCWCVSPSTFPLVSPMRVLACIWG